MLHLAASWFDIRPGPLLAEPLEIEKKEGRANFVDAKSENTNCTQGFTNLFFFLKIWKITKSRHFEIRCLDYWHISSELVAKEF